MRNKNATKEEINAWFRKYNAEHREKRRRYNRNWMRNYRSKSVDKVV